MIFSQLYQKQQAAIRRLQYPRQGVGIDEDARTCFASGILAAASHLLLRGRHNEHAAGDYADVTTLGERVFVQGDDPKPATWQGWCCGQCNYCSRRLRFRNRIYFYRVGDEVMKYSILLSTVALAACTPSAPDAAEKAHSEHAVAAAATPSAKALTEANAKMHKDMAIVLTGDVDTDFIRSMIPHHEGAVAMAKIVLANGGRSVGASEAIPHRWLRSGVGADPFFSAGYHIEFT